MWWENKNTDHDNRCFMSAARGVLTPKKLDSGLNEGSYVQEGEERCEGNLEKQHQLVKLIVERVYIEDALIVAMTLKADDHIVLGYKENEPAKIMADPFIHEWAARGSNP